MRFHLQAHLNQQHAAQQRQFALNAGTREEFNNWQKDFRVALTQVLGIEGRIPEETPQVEQLSSHDKGPYIEEKHVFVLDDVAIPMVFLIPKVPPPYKVIFAFHGHGLGVRQILGDYPDESMAQQMIAQDENFAQRLVEDGYVVCAIEQRGFGERIAAQVSENANSCRQLAWHYLMFGTTLLGERIRDAIAAINYLQSRDDIAPDFLGCTGHSGGAATALFLAALDTRLSVNVISGYFCDYQESILAMRHCECNYVPNLLTLANIGDIAALIAPRPLRLINGERDHIFPISGVNKPYQVLNSAYQLTDAETELSLKIHPDGHQYHYLHSLRWFQSKWD